MSRVSSKGKNWDDNLPSNWKLENNGKWNIMTAHDKTENLDL